MNEKLNYHEVEVGQSSKGVWYCKSIKICNSDDEFVVDTTDNIISEMETVLKKYNEPEQKETKGDN
ncbi:MAG: hypothetical protein U9P49_06390 [Thermodesulfobacteriota bacterium]|nr:hypothetical protein [Thermodesulfobacteriota bacterium]